MKSFVDRLVEHATKFQLSRPDRFNPKIVRSSDHQSELRRLAERIPNPND